MSKRKNPAPVVNPMGKIKLKKVIKQGNIMEENIKNEADLLFLDDEQVNSIEKDAAWSPAFKNGFYGALGTMGATALMGMAGMAYDNWKTKNQNRKYQQALMQAIAFSPALKRYDLATLESYMPMIIKSSPTVAADPRLLANYLESMLDAEGHLNLSTFKELSGIENTILNNQAMVSPWRGEMIKGLAKGIGQKGGEIFAEQGRKMIVGEYGSDEKIRQQVAVGTLPAGKPGEGNING